MFKLLRSNEFWWNVDFDWVGEDGEVERETIRFRFLRTTIQDYRERVDAMSKRRAELPDEDKLKFVVDLELMLELITDVDEGVVVEGITDTRKKIRTLLSYTAILTPTVLAYQNAVMSGGQTKDAIKK